MGDVAFGLSDDEIPLLSWSLHLLGEAEWAVARVGSLTVSVRGVSLEFLC